MKHNTPIFITALFLGAGVLFFTSCAGNEVKSQNPVESNLSPVLTPVPETNQAGIVAAVAQPVEKPFPPSHKTWVKSRPVVLAASSASAPQVVPAVSQPLDPAATSTQPNFAEGWKGWPWLLLLLLLLLLLALGRWIWSQYKRDKGFLMAGAGLTESGGTALAEKEISAKDGGLAKKGILAKVTGLTHKMLLAKRAKLAHKAAATKEAGLTHSGTLAAGAGLAHKVIPANVAGLGKDEILVEGAGLTEVVKVSIKRGATFQEIIVSVARIGNFPAKKAYVFLENEAVPLNPNHILDEKHPRHQIHHVHTQKEIELAVHFNGLEYHANFSPATTVKKALAWATTQFKIHDQDGKETHLSIPGASEHLQDNVHIGRFVTHDKNRLVLNIVTHRVSLIKN